MTSRMISSLRSYSALLLIICTLALANGCSEAVRSFKDMGKLREELIKEYGAQDVNVSLWNGNFLDISFVNSSFNDLDRARRADKSLEMAFFVKKHYASIDKIDKIRISFVLHKSYFIFFKYNEVLDSFAFDKSTLTNMGIENHVAQPVGASSYYSSAQKTTVVSTDPVQLYGDIDNGLVLIAYFNAPGEKVVAPEWVYFDFASYADKRIFSQDRSFSLFADGQAVATDEAKLVSSGKTNNGRTSEFLTQAVTYRQFLQMINSRDVKIKLGPKQFALTEEHLEVLRDMKRCIDESRCARRN